MMAIFGKKDEDPLLLMQKGDYKQAVKLLQAKIKATPRDLALKLKLAEAYEAMGEKEKAARVYMTEASENLNEGQKEKAFALMKKAEKLLPDDEEIKNSLKALDVKKENESFSFDISMDSSETAEEEVPPDDKSQVMEALQALLKGRKDGIEKIASICTTIRLENRETLIREGEKGDSMYLILDGTLDVVTNIGGGDKCIKSLSRGEIAGEASFLKGVPRTATLVSNGPVTVAELKGDDAREVLKSNPGLLESLEKILEQRVEDFIKQLREKK
jgi:hypothetical protein